MKANSSKEALPLGGLIMEKDMTAGQLPLASPSLGLWWAMDHCAARLGGLEKVALYTDSPFFVEHIQMRLPICSVNPDQGIYSAALWAAPGGREWQRALDNITQHLAPNGLLFCLALGPAARWLPEGRAGAIPRSRILAPWQLLRELSRGGYHVQGWLGFNTPASIFWGRMSLILEGLDQPLWADRARARMLEGFTGAGIMALLSPLVLLCATRPSGMSEGES